MERTMTVEERIRRAEDIYNRRNGGYASGTPKEKVNQQKSKKSTVKKLFMQAFVCLSIYIIFYAVTNRDYIFSEEFRNEVNVFFTQKTKISEFYNNTKNYIQSKFNKSKEEDKSGENSNTEEANKTNGDSKDESDKTNGSETNADTGEEEQNLQDKNDNTNQEKNDKQNKDENIGGATENKEENKKDDKDSKDKKNEEVSEHEIMEKDAKEIKAKVSFIAPLKGRISSTFGWRSPSTDTVPKYHTGVDIAAKEGTVIKSATDGKVVMVSSKGDYGNHYQIQIKDVIVIYAHCKKLYLKEGDSVKQGQKIAEVGSTGNSTGAHLHFEIRKSGRKVDPQMVVNI